MRKIVLSSVPYSDNIEQWISSNVTKPKGNCFFYSGVLALLDSSLTLKEGKPADPDRGETAHFYLEDSDGKVIDPTKKQLKKLYEYKGKTIDVKKNIGALVKDPLFKTLHKQDQDKILAR